MRGQEADMGWSIDIKTDKEVREIDIDGMVFDMPD